MDGLWTADNFHQGKMFSRSWDLLGGVQSLQEGIGMPPMQGIQIGRASAHKPEDASQWTQRFQSWLGRPSHTRTFDPPKIA